jgi:hypothetical protein
MTKTLAAAFVLALCVIAPSALRAQAATPQMPPTPPAAKPVVPVMVDIVLSRYDGTRKVSSMPFSVLVNVNDMQGSYARKSSLRMGVDVPIGTVTSTSQQGVVTSRPDYRSVGTNIDCGGVTLDDGRFKLELSIVDSSIFTADQDSRVMPRHLDPAAFRTFSTSNFLTLREGQTLQFTMATDKISGEVLKVDVTVTTIK